MTRSPVLTVTLDHAAPYGPSLVRDLYIVGLFVGWVLACMVAA